MKHFLTILALLLPFAVHAAGESTPDIVPAPQSIQMGKGSCRLSGITVNIDESIDARTRKMIGRFADRLSLVSSRTSSVATPIGLKRSVASGKMKGMSFLIDGAMVNEAYSIVVAKNTVVVRASSYSGFFYAVQTIKQMLPKQIYGTVPAENCKWSIPCCTITDTPRFAHRGILLDCCRHFWSIDEVKKILDVMSVYKLNRLHWHLTEDQGWRIEIKKYPLLTEVGAFRDGTQNGREPGDDGIRYGGFYTQEQLRDVVAYAASLAIEIVPEVDMPGHMQAALASYPELGCAGSEPQPYKVRTTWGVSRQVLNVGKESTMKFLEDVMDELCGIFPFEYYHIGGDECPRDEWAKDPDCQAKIRELGLVSDDKASAEARLQNYVTARMQKFLAARGKKIIGWDEILEGELSEGAVVMSWRGSKGGIKASSMGHDVIMTPNTHCYFDYSQSYDWESEPRSFTDAKRSSRVVTLDKLYNWDPFEGIAPEYQHHILGLQGNLWTEFIAEPDYLEYMLLPRMLALSEVQWCPVGGRDFNRFKSSLTGHQFGILDILGCNYRSKIEPEDQKQ